MAPASPVAVTGPAKTNGTEQAPVDTGIPINVNDYGPLVVPAVDHSALNAALEADEFANRLDASVRSSTRVAQALRDSSLQNELIRMTGNIPAFDIAKSDPKAQATYKSPWDPDNRLGLTTTRPDFSSETAMDLLKRPVSGPMLVARDPEAEAYQRLATANQLKNALFLGTPAGFPGAMSKLAGQDEYKVAAAHEIGGAILGVEMAFAGLPGRGSVVIRPSGPLDPIPSVNPVHVAEMRGNGIKFSSENLIATGRNSNGQVVFLESGSAKGGLQHIFEGHLSDFANIGVAGRNIPSLVMRAATEGELVGYQGRGTGRGIYEITLNGQPQRIAVSVATNGFIVGANPAGKGGKK